MRYGLLYWYVKQKYELLVCGPNIVRSRWYCVPAYKAASIDIDVTAGKVLRLGYCGSMSGAGRTVAGRKGPGRGCW